MKDKKIMSYGEIMLRLSSPTGRLCDADSFDSCYGGTDANVLAMLNKLGHSVKYLSALPDNGLGAATVAHLNSHGIDTSDVVIGGNKLGIYFTEAGSGSRGSSVIYYRSDSEFTRLHEGSFDCDKVFDGVELFHTCGISFALSDSSRALAFKLMREARSRGIPTSFDVNYRAKLWTADAARPIMREAVRLADIVFAGPLDLEVFFGVKAEDYIKEYGGRYLVLRDRRILAPDRHAVSVKVYGDSGLLCSVPEREFAVSERIGGGDAFSGAMLHGFVSGTPVEEAARFAVAAFALKATVPGDTFTLGKEDIERYRKVIGV